MYAEVPVWKVAPFFRILFFLITGLLIQWYLQVSVNWLIVVAGITICSHFLFKYLNPRKRYQLRTIQGSLICLQLVLAGMLLIWLKNPVNDNHWYANYAGGNNYLLLSIISEPVEKNKITEDSGTATRFDNKNRLGNW